MRFNCQTNRSFPKLYAYNLRFKLKKKNGRAFQTQSSILVSIITEFSNLI